MDALLAGRGIELKVEIEVNDHETIRLMVQQGAAASILPYSSVARECAARLIAAHRITEDGIFRTLALGVRAQPHCLAGARGRRPHDYRVVAERNTAAALALPPQPTARSDERAPLRMAA